MMRRLTTLGVFMGSHFGRDVVMVVAIVVLSLAFSIAFNIETILSYAISGDNFAPMLYSASFFDVSPVDWLINGFRYYFWVYPELFVDAHYFIRPTQNLLIYLMSLFAETPNSALFLVTYYLVHSLCCALVYLYSRFFCRLSQKISLLVAFIFWGTMASEGIYVAAPAFGGEALGALLGMGALLLAYVYLNHVDRYKRLIFATLFILLMLTVYTKESIITAPFIVAIYWFWDKLYQEKQKFNLNSSLVILQRNWVALALLMSPIVVYVLHIFILRFIFDSGLAVYPFQQNPLSFLKTPIYTLLSYFFPLEQLNAGVFIKSLLSGESQPPVLLLRTSVAVLFNLASLAFILLVFVKDKLSNGHFDSRFSLLIVLAIVSMAVPLFLHAGQRFMYFGQMFSIPLLIYTLSRFYDFKKRYIKYLVSVVLIAFVLLNPIYLFFSKLPMQRSEIITTNQASLQLQEVLRDELKNQQIKRVYLLNDITGHYAALTQLRFIAALANREDLQLRFVNSIIRYSPLQKKATEGVTFEKREDDLCVTTRIDEERFFFGSVGLHQIEKLGIAGIIQYEFGEMPLTSWEDMKVMTACIPNAAKNDILLIGFDPAESGVHVWKSERPIWQPVR